jgi:predicted dehydrogenase
MERLAACDEDRERTEFVAKEFGAVCFSDLGAALQKFDANAVFICTPPVHHVAQAIQALQAGAHIFIEKPLSDRMDQIEQLTNEAGSRGAVVQVGYNLRFHPPIEKLKRLVDDAVIGKVQWAQFHAASYLPEWRPWQDYRKSYTARRELGGGILLDGSHEIDYVTWLLGKPKELACMAGRVSELEVDTEDCATMLLAFPGGERADVHVDFVQRSYCRCCTLAGPEGKLDWDFTENAIRITRPSAECERVQFDCEVNEMYVAEIRHFLECAETGLRPRCGLEESILTLQIALAARRAAEEKTWVTLA